MDNELMHNSAAPANGSVRENNHFGKHCESKLD